MVVIFFAMVGYPILLIFLDKILKPSKCEKDYVYSPTVTLMIVAHNEIDVIEKKLENSIGLDYPNNKLEILVASDNSDDGTNEAVEDFITKHPKYRIRLYKAKDRKGKTNAQNEAQKTVNSEILIMTDANSMFEKDALKEIVASFGENEDIAYVCGRLLYTNQSAGETSSTESSYWDLDLKLRDIESRFQTITAGNGAIYGCRNRMYYDFNPIQCHDSAMPVHYALQNKKAIFNPDAIAYEKAGETDGDEFARKVRMSRGILKAILPSVKILNVFSKKWFSLFYFGHRTCRYLLWLAHILILVLSGILTIQGSLFYRIIFVLQMIVYLCMLVYALCGLKIKYVHIICYYCMTVVAQCKGVWNILTGKAKPFWEKAESTR